MSKIKTAEARLNVFIRLLGLLFLILGAIIAYYTATTNLTPQIPPVFYGISVIMVTAGFIVLVSKLE